MANDEQTKNRDALYRLLEDVDKYAPEIEEMGHNAIRSARLARDVASSLRDVVAKMPNDDMLPDEHWQRAKDGWNALRNTAQPVIKAKANVNDLMFTVSASTVTTSSFVYAIGPLTPSFAPVVESAKDQLARILDKFPLMDEVRFSMTRLGLNVVRASKRSPLQLLDDAKLALDQPQTPEADGALLVLLPLRECIEATLAELIRRRPQQESASKTVDKIISIGKQCGRTTLPPDYFDRLGADCFDLVNRLSGAKQATMLRVEIMKLFSEG